MDHYNERLRPDLETLWASAATDMPEAAVPALRELLRRFAAPDVTDQRRAAAAMLALSTTG
jgi:hypothetical protein